MPLGIPLILTFLLLGQRIFERTQLPCWHLHKFLSRTGVPRGAFRSPTMKKSLIRGVAQVSSRLQLCSIFSLLGKACWLLVVLPDIIAERGLLLQLS